MTKVRDVDNGGDHASVVGRGVWEISLLSVLYCCEPKTALKK